MFLSDFDYELPKKLIAQEPISPRDNSKMLLIGNKEFRDKHLYPKFHEKFIDEFHNNIKQNFNP